MKQIIKNSLGQLMAGVAKRNITTKNDRVLVKDPLYAKVLVLDDGSKQIVIIAMDITAIAGRKISQEIRYDVSEDFLPNLRKKIRQEFGIEGRNVLVNASHTHPPGRLLCGDDEQLALVFDAIKEAVQNLAPVSIGTGIGREDRISINRTLRLKNGKHWTIRHSNPCPPDDAVVDIGDRT